MAMWTSHEVYIIINFMRCPKESKKWVILQAHKGFPIGRQ